MSLQNDEFDPRASAPHFTRNVGDLRSRFTELRPRESVEPNTCELPRADPPERRRRFELRDHAQIAPCDNGTDVFSLVDERSGAHGANLSDATARGSTDSASLNLVLERLDLRVKRNELRFQTNDVELQRCDARASVGLPGHPPTFELALLRPKRGFGRCFTLSFCFAANGVDFGDCSAFLEALDAIELVASQGGGNSRLLAAAGGFVDSGLSLIAKVRECLFFGIELRARGRELRSDARDPRPHFAELESLRFRVKHHDDIPFLDLTVEHEVHLHGSTGDWSVYGMRRV
ncbi:hypothetical protein LZC94_28880 [Pendulispora albinea]|uniref:Uncharacterized protein n=1 Tax=Pendulispora albinea TaxID=2741071 RepID=A0ABZ2LNE5_9BACT